MSKVFKTAVLAIVILYMAMCTLTKFDGGDLNDMPSGSATEAGHMLVKRVTVVIDSGGPAGVHDAWIEIGATTHYRFGILPTRVPIYGIGRDTLFILSVATPRDMRLEGEQKVRTSHAGDVIGYDVTPPLPDTIHIGPKQAGNYPYQVTFKGRKAD